jgi:hypothetical protein
MVTLGCFTGSLYNFLALYKVMATGNDSEWEDGRNKNIDLLFPYLLFNFTGNIINIKIISLLKIR